jgi:hypothetical protein
MNVNDEVLYKKRLWRVVAEKDGMYLIRCISTPWKLEWIRTEHVQKLDEKSTFGV